eukprot:PITA_19324
MVEEYASIMKNDVWEIMPRPKGKSVVTSRWLYKIKNVANGSVEKFKARFLVWGFSQVEGANYEETFAPIARYTSIRAVISIAAEMGWRTHRMDVNTAFLNGVIQEEVYIKQPQGFKVHGRKSHVCTFKKALYGLKKGPKAWYERINSYLQQMGFQKSDANPNLYFIMVGDDPLIQEDGHIFMGQGKYVEDILERFCMEGCIPMATPMITNWKKMHASDSELVNLTLYRHLISSLMYLVNTRLDLCFTINILSQFRMEPGRVHWVAVKHVLRYLQGIVDYSLDDIRGDGVRLRGCTNSD